MEADILVLDDDPRVCELLAFRLHHYGSVRAFHHGIEALQATLIQEPDLVITDVEVQGLSGRALHAALQADEETQRIPFVFLAHPHHRADCKEVMRPIDAFVPKPFRDGALETAVTNALALASPAP